jgi:CIC family chloride channel protein
MAKLEIERASTTEGLPVSPSLGPALQMARMPTHTTPINGRVVLMCVVSVGVGAVAGWAAQLLIAVIALFTNISFYGRVTFAHADARGNHLGPWVIAIPVIGAAIVGLIARFGSRGVAGHGIPEAMEHVLTNQSRIPAKMTFLKPLSAAISIGTGGPFGPEGPIIATGGALGSLVGQLMSTTAAERKVLLSAGAAAGIAAAFGTPIAAVLLAIELLLFEFRPRSIIPVVFAVAAATMVHAQFEGLAPMFPFSGAPPVFPDVQALLTYTMLGSVIGVAAVVLTRSVYGVERFFEHLPIHWMWQPALGAVVVGVIGYMDARTLGPGYFNLDYLLSNHVALTTAAILCVLKFFSWTISLGSGTSGGTLAPVFTIGGSFAAVLGFWTLHLFPSCGIDLRVVALMGMVAIFAGASRALLTSVIFAFEVTRQNAVMLPVLCGCATAYVISALLMRHSIMTEKLASQGVRVPVEYGADDLEQMLVQDVMTPDPDTLSSAQTVGDTRLWLKTSTDESEHQGFPVVDEQQILVGVLTRRDVFNEVAPQTPLAYLIRRPPVLVYADCTLRDAVDHMINHNIGRLPVIRRGEKGNVVGIITRSDILSVHRQRHHETTSARRSLDPWRWMRGQRAGRHGGENGEAK